METSNLAFKKTIDRALMIIDFQIVDEDKNDFYIYAYNTYYNTNLNYSYPDIKLPKYYKFLLKEIQRFPLIASCCYC